MLLVFAIGFSGYSAAAHAFGHEFCDKSIEMQNEQHDLHDHQQDTDTKRLDNQKKCTDCLIALQPMQLAYLITLLLILLTWLRFQIHSLPYGFTDEVFFSLLRPQNPSFDLNGY